MECWSYLTFTSRCTRWISRRGCPRVGTIGSDKSRSADRESRSRSSSARSPVDLSSSPSGCCSRPHWGSWSSSAGLPTPSGSSHSPPPSSTTGSCVSPSWRSGRGGRATGRSGCRAGGPGGTSRPTPSPPGCSSGRTRCRSQGRTRRLRRSRGTGGWSAGLARPTCSPAQDLWLAAVGELLTWTCGWKVWSNSLTVIRVTFRLWGNCCFSEFANMDV